MSRLWKLLVMVGALAAAFGYNGGEAHDDAQGTISPRFPIFVSSPLILTLPKGRAGSQQARIAHGFDGLTMSDLRSS